MPTQLNHFPKIPDNNLTDSEIEVLQLAVFGLTNEQISEKRFTSKRTTEIHMSHIMEKLNSKDNKSKAIINALRLGIVSLY